MLANFLSVFAVRGTTSLLSSLSWLDKVGRDTRNMYSYFTAWAGERFEYRIIEHLFEWKYITNKCFKRLYWLHAKTFSASCHHANWLMHKQGELPWNRNQIWISLFQVLFLSSQKSRESRSARSKKKVYFYCFVTKLLSSQSVTHLSPDNIMYSSTDE